MPADEKQIHLARSWLKNSRRAIMIAGLDAVAENASGSIRSFYEKFNMPVITTHKGKGLVPAMTQLKCELAGERSGIQTKST